MGISPGVVRDHIFDHLSTAVGPASIADIRKAISARIGPVPASSVRSYLNLNTPKVFERTGRGMYRLRPVEEDFVPEQNQKPVFKSGLAELYNADCFEWLKQAKPNSIHAVVTDPPYGLVEYSEAEKKKLRDRKGGGVWRVPPSFDGHVRAPLPRFTTLSENDLQLLHAFFKEFGTLLSRVVVPGANVLVACNPLLSHIVASALGESGLEVRGYITRLVMTMRGGDRPKNAHREFSGVSVMPRSQFEPWVMLRKPLEGRVQDNLRKWGTGGFKRISDERPFGDVIVSRPTSSTEKKIADHPSLKPQELLRKLVLASLPLGKGTILDPFAGSGSTLAACNAIGYKSIGIEKDSQYVGVARKAIPALAKIEVRDGAGTG